ncbi:MAG: hypothetical protein H0V17_05440 [Deltaproteobacteria bacterium]|nr:hypothetical protein [Deltaproteobacteria bacterium]
MRKLVIVALVLGLGGSARAESIGIGVFVGQPTGLDLKIGLQGRSALDIVLGATRFDEPRASYGHLQYLVLLGVARGQSVNVPLRLGIGVAIAGVTEDATAVAARVPLQLGLRFRRTPLEIYGEIAFVLQLIDDVDTDIDGGIGLRVYF